MYVDYKKKLNNDQKIPEPKKRKHKHAIIYLCA